MQLRRPALLAGAWLASAFVMACSSEKGNKNQDGPGDPGVVADPGPEFSVEPGLRITLDGTRSRSSHGAIAAWSWKQLGGPAVVLEGAETARATFEVPGGEDAVGAVLAFELAVTDETSRSARAELQLAVTEPSGIEETTSVGKLHRALRRGTLDRTTAVRYLAYAVRGDPRLPAEWTGTEPEPSGSRAMHTIVRELETLPEAVREELRPFLLPPDHPDGWFLQRASAAKPPGPGAAGVPNFRRADGPHVRVVYPDGIPGLQAKAEAIRDAVEETIWPALEELWGPTHVPLLDFPGSTGGRLDIFLVPGLPSYGVETPFSAPPSPSFIELQAELPLQATRAPALLPTVAHELTHSCQDSYRQHQGYHVVPWVFEGIATWAMDHVYPEADMEHDYARHYLRSMHRPLDEDAGLRSYGTYLFFQYAAHGDPDYVRRVFEEFQTKPARQAIEDALEDGTVADVWGDFLEAAWNRGAAGWFRETDGLESEAQGKAGAAPEPIPAGSGPDLALELDGRVRSLSGVYRHFVFDDARHRWFRFYDGLSNRLWIQEDWEDEADAGRKELWWEALDEEARRGIDVRVLVKKDGAWESRSFYDSSWFNDLQLGAKSACRDRLDERFEEIVFIFGNGRLKKGDNIEPPERGPTLWVTNIGCYGWEGTASAASLDSTEIRASGHARFLFDPTSGTPFNLVEESGSWSVSGGPAGCEASGSGDWSLIHERDEVDPDVLGFDFTTLAGLGHRAMSGTWRTPKIVYTVTCRDGEEVTEQYTQETYLSLFTDELWCDDEILPGPYVGDDGVTASGSNDCDPMVQHDWSFTAFRE
jgi:hypothetical protein